MSRKATRGVFVGNSGKFRLESTLETDKFIDVSQSKIEEVDADGKTVFSFNVAGKNTWAVEPAFNGIPGVTRYLFTTSIRNPTKGQAGEFKLSAITSENDTSLVDPVAGPDMISVIAGSVKFSVQITNWPFRNAENMLHYTITMSSAIAPVEAARDVIEGRVQLQGGRLQFPSFGLVRKENSYSKEKVSVTTKPSVRGTDITFLLPNGKDILYDPDVILGYVTLPTDTTESPKPNEEAGMKENEGSTPQDCVCTREYAPVCVCAENKQFANICFAQCAGYAISSTSTGMCTRACKNSSTVVSNDRGTSVAVYAGLGGGLIILLLLAYKYRLRQVIWKKLYDGKSMF